MIQLPFFFGWLGETAAGAGPEKDVGERRRVLGE